MAATMLKISGQDWQDLLRDQYESCLAPAGSEVFRRTHEKVGSLLDKLTNQCHGFGLPPN